MFCSRTQHTAAGVRTVYLCIKNRHSIQPTNMLYRHDFCKCVDLKSNEFKNNSHYVCTNEEIRSEFKRNAAGPDGISPKVIRMCSSQLCEIFCTILNLPFLCCVVSDIWKSSCIVPVPKNNKEGSMNDLRRWNNHNIPYMC